MLTYGELRSIYNDSNHSEFQIELLDDEAFARIRLHDVEGILDKKFHFKYKPIASPIQVSVKALQAKLRFKNPIEVESKSKKWKLSNEVQIKSERATVTFKNPIEDNLESAKAKTEPSNVATVALKNRKIEVNMQASDAKVILKNENKETNAVEIQRINATMIFKHRTDLKIELINATVTSEDSTEIQLQPNTPTEVMEA